MVRAGREQRWYAWGLAIVVLIALAVRLTNFWAPIDRHQFASLNFALMGSKLYYLYGQGEANGSLYYTALGWWCSCFGWTLATARVFSLITSLGSVLLAAALGRRLGGPAAGLFAALFLAINALDVYLATYLRFYAMCAWWHLAAFYCLLRLYPAQGTPPLGWRLLGWRGLYLVALMAAVSSMICSGVVLLGHVWYIIAPRGQNMATPQRRGYWQAMALSALMCLFLLALLHFDPDGYSRQASLPAADASVFYGAWGQLLGINDYPAQEPLLIGTWQTACHSQLIVKVILGFLGWVGIVALARQRVYWLLGWLAAPFLLWAYSQIARPLISPWNLAFILPAVALVLGIALARLSARWQIVALVSIALSFAPTINSRLLDSDPSAQQVCRLLEQYAQPGDLLMVANPQAAELMKTSLEPFGKYPTVYLNGYAPYRFCPALPAHQVSNLLADKLAFRGWQSSSPANEVYRDLPLAGSQQELFSLLNSRAAQRTVWLVTALPEIDKQNRQEIMANLGKITASAVWPEFHLAVYRVKRALPDAGE